jgi:hypothetical protein
MEKVEQFDDISIEDLVEGVSACATFDSLLIDHRCRAELPENAPRFIVLSYEHNRDGIKSFPLVLVNWIPASETGLLTLHASAFLDFQRTVRSPPRWVAHLLTFGPAILPHRQMSAR